MLWRWHVLFFYYIFYLFFMRICIIISIENTSTEMRWEIAHPVEAENEKNRAEKRAL